MSKPFTRSQINKLGERLRSGASDDDLRMLSEYRNSHEVALEITIREVEECTRLTPVGRPKSNQSIIEKLRRQSTRLSQMQDIAGCRLVVEGPMQQRQLLESLLSRFPGAEIHDRRAKPSNGYRAVHLVVQHVDEQHVEIQLRTELQDLWAQCSERLADLHGIEVKYGGGPPEISALLTRLSEFVAEIERLQMLASPNAVADRVREAELPARLRCGYAMVGESFPQLRYLLGMLPDLVVSSRQAR